MTKKKRAQRWARFQVWRRKPQWPALIAANSQIISAAGSGPASLASGELMLNPAKSSAHHGTAILRRHRPREKIQMVRRG